MRNEATGQKVSLSSGIQSFWLNKERFSPELCTALHSCASLICVFLVPPHSQLAAVNKVFMKCK